MTWRHLIQHNEEYKMKVIPHDYQKSIFFISGMFAGSWIWDRCRSNILPSRQILIEDALCAISNNVDDLVKLSGQQLEQQQGKITLVGNSLGALVALLLAQKYPNKVEQVLISGSAGFCQPNLGMRFSRANALAIASKVTEKVCHKTDKLTEEDKIRTSVSFKQHLSNLVGLTRDSNAISGTDVLPQVNCPVKAIWGREDVITPLNAVQDTFNDFGVPLTIIDECGHSPMYENPDDFAKWVNQCIHEANNSNTLQEAA